MAGGVVGTGWARSLTEVSQLAIANTRRREIAERNSGLRALLDEVISGAEASIQSLGAGLEQQRANAEQARAQLEETARATVEQTRQRMDEMAAAQQEAIGRKANEVIAGAEMTVQSLTMRLEQERMRAEQAGAQIENNTAWNTVEQTRQRMDEMVAAQQEAIGRKAGEVIAERIQQIEPVLQNSAQKVMEHFSGELDRKLTPQFEAAQKAAGDLAYAAASKRLNCKAASECRWNRQRNTRRRFRTRHARGCTRNRKRPCRVRLRDWRTPGSRRTSCKASFASRHSKLPNMWRCCKAGR